jgi:hypothetical protein
MAGLVERWASHHIYYIEFFSQICRIFFDYWSSIRHKSIKVTYLDENGDKKVMKAHGVVAAAIQHERDHLDGKLFLERMTQGMDNISYDCIYVISSNDFFIIIISI